MPLMVAASRKTSRPSLFCEQGPTGVALVGDAHQEPDLLVEHIRRPAWPLCVDKLSRAVGRHEYTPGRLMDYTIIREAEGNSFSGPL
jgi:hypothetical protein